MSSLVNKYKFDITNLLLISLLSPFFFYNISAVSLGSWDEAWYGEIARNILKTGNIFNLWWNGDYYFDHPPAGFWVMAIFQLIFGSNEFGIRAASAAFGVIGLFITYLLGRELFSRFTGLVSAVSLSSAYWYLFRSRSGNLDIFLTVFFILTFFLAVKSSKNSKYLIPFGLSFALLFLTKSIIPLTIIPALVIIFWKSKIKTKDFIKPLVAFTLIIIPWLIATLINTPSAFSRYLFIGAPGVGQQNNYFENLKLIKEYLHLGIGKWFWPGVLGIIAGPFTLNKNLIALIVFCLSFFLPFLLSHKGHIWHLIPLYPFMILSFFGFLETVSRIISKKFFTKFQKPLHLLTLIGMSLISVYFSQMQIKRSWYEFIDNEPFISDEKILSQKAAEFHYDFYIDGEDFRPAAVFYSGKKVTLLANRALEPLFDSNKKFVLITYPDRLKLYNIEESEYRFIAEDRNRILIVRD